MQVLTTDRLDDPEWDEFLLRTPGAYHTQSSLWAQAKVCVGWKPVRIVARRGSVIGGVQLLLKERRPFGSIAFAPRGPVLEHDSGVVEPVIDEIHRVAAEHGLRFVVLQSSVGPVDVSPHLLSEGFEPDFVEGLPIATTIVDLEPDEDEILARMKSKTRYNIRVAARRGVVVREGTRADLPAFYELLLQTGNRQAFGEPPLEYFDELVRVLEPGDHVKLWLVEQADEPVSALLAIAFGDTVVFKKGAWSGRHGSSHPNEAMHWAAIRWAKSRGYRFYDMEGLDRSAATHLLEHGTLPADAISSVTRFKLGFGGRVLVTPAPLGRAYGLSARTAYRIGRSRIGQRVVGHAVRRARRV